MNKPKFPNVFPFIFMHFSSNMIIKFNSTINLVTGIFISKEIIDLFLESSVWETDLSVPLNIEVLVCDF